MEIDAPIAGTIVLIHSAVVDILLLLRWKLGGVKRRVGDYNKVEEEEEEEEQEA